MARFTVQVEIDCDTLAQAQQVIAERISPDEDYGFDYTIGYREVKVPKDVAVKLHNIRASIEREEVSTGELIELQGLTAYIGEGDNLLREWAGMPEFPED